MLLAMSNSNHFKSGFACRRVTFFAPAKKVTKESRPRSAVSGRCAPTDPLRASHPAARAETRPAGSDTCSLISARCSSAQLLQGVTTQLRKLNAFATLSSPSECRGWSPLEAPRSAEQRRRERALFESRSGGSRVGRVAQRPVLIEHRREPATSGRRNGGALFLGYFFLGTQKEVTRQQAKKSISEHSEIKLSARRQRP